MQKIKTHWPQLLRPTTNVVYINTRTAKCKVIKNTCKNKKRILYKNTLKLNYYWYQPPLPLLVIG